MVISAATTTVDLLSLAYGMLKLLLLYSGNDLFDELEIFTK